MLEIFLLLLPLFALIGIGYLIGQTKIADKEWVRVLNLFGFYIAFPALIAKSLMATHIVFSVHGRIMLVQLIFSVALIILTWLACKAIGMSKENRNTFTIGVYFANAAYIGIPSLDIVFGDAAAAEGAVIVAVMILVTFTLGVGILENSRNAELQIKELIIGILKNPLIWSAVIGLLLSVYNIALWQPLTELINLTAAAASPAVLVALGIFLALNKPKRETLKLASVLAIIKIALIPALFTLVLIVLPNSDWLDITYIQASMPLAVTTFAFAEIYPMNKALVSTAIVISTVPIIIILPLIMWISTVI